MEQVFDRTTLFIMVSAFITALLCIFPQSCSIFPFWMMAAGLHIGDTLFHEMGHTVFAWLFGRPAIPMIFTLFGADQAGGMSLQWERIWFVQIAAFAVLGYGCYRAKRNASRLFIPAVIFSLLIVAAVLMDYGELVITYMGHGGAVLMGGFFLFRAWVYMDSRNQFERWLNALFGFFLTLCNLVFSYNLAFKGDEEYSEHIAFSISHNDFKVISDMIPGWSVKNIGCFTIGYCIATIVVSFLLALWFRTTFPKANGSAEDISDFRISRSFSLFP